MHYAYLNFRRGFFLILPCFLHFLVSNTRSSRAPFPVFPIKSRLPPLILAKGTVYPDSTLLTAKTKILWLCIPVSCQKACWLCLPLCGVTRMSHYFTALAFANGALLLTVQMWTINCHPSNPRLSWSWTLSLHFPLWPLLSLALTPLRPQCWQGTFLQWTLVLNVPFV